VDKVGIAFKMGWSWKFSPDSSGYVAWSVGFCAV